MTTQISVKEKTFALQGGAVQMGSLGLMITRDLSFAEWEMVGAQLNHVQRGLMWGLGDWLVYGDHRFSELYAQGIPEERYAKQTLLNAQWVASRIEPARRRQALSWSHHREVASLEPDEQEQLLDAAERGGWPVSELRRCVQIAKGTIPAEKTGDDAKPEDMQNPDLSNDDLVVELELASARLRELEGVVASLNADDRANEIVRLHTQLSGLNARVVGLTNEKNAAVDQAQRAESMLRRIRDTLRVESNREIIPALESRAA